MKKNLKTKIKSKKNRKRKKKKFLKIQIFKLQKTSLKILKLIMKLQLRF